MADPTIVPRKSYGGQKPSQSGGFSTGTSLVLAIDPGGFREELFDMGKDIPTGEEMERWEKIPMPQNQDGLNSELIEKLMKRLELAFEDAQRELDRLN